MKKIKFQTKQTQMTNPIDDYINSFPESVSEILNKIRQIGKNHAPNAVEKISYQIPSFHENGVIFYYAAFKNHFSIFPPIHGDDELLEKVKPYSNPKGNLLFKYKNPIPFDLIEKVILRRIQENDIRKNSQ